MADVIECAPPEFAIGHVSANSGVNLYPAAKDIENMANAIGATKEPTDADDTYVRYIRQFGPVRIDLFTSL